MFSAKRISYKKTGYFSKIIIDYLEGNKTLQPFYHFPVNTTGIEAAIKARNAFDTNRAILSEVLKAQYATIETENKVRNNIEQLLKPNCYTICTAHQPNLATGPLYFIYKILHAIKLADRFNKDYPDAHFIPVYYMGSEDADLAELNHFNVKGKRYEWHTKQTGAVGRMKVDQKLLSLLDELEKQLVTHVHGEEILQLLKQCYSEGNSIMQSTFELVNALFGRFGLVVLIADEAQLKMQATTVFKDDLLQHLPSAIVNQTVHKLEAQYNVQATARDINLFYLDGSVRERIEKGKNGYKVVNTALHFTESEMLDLLAKQPEKLSPNVILRGLYQEIILPNIVFVGGGGEVAYWLELKDLFMHYQVPFPLLVLRNSFLLAGKRTVENIGKTALSYEEIFLPVNEIMFKIVERNSKNEVLLKDGLSKATTVLNEIRQQAGTIDPSLVNHVAAIEKRLIKTLVELEKKMLRAEKRKFSDLQKQVENIKQAIFPGNALQERKENFTGFYAEYGKRFIDDLYEHSLTLEQEFMFLEEAPNQTR